ncbi:uncharacterized protein SCHCODRAFT_02518806 [Schizophyllum commune H4-8]|nr:uncharacterized protein SCHCODRAFT_02518806 [Schizophyllum commune H4-8]KAI5886095.1 hypothetical protein SCHCODRAFT_02518806 [Schizophyllum commune H4-8]
MHAKLNLTCPAGFGKRHTSHQPSLSPAEKECIGQTIVRTYECLEKHGAEVKDLMAMVAQLREGEQELKERRKVQQAYLVPGHHPVAGFSSLLARSSCHLRRLFLVYPPRGILDALYSPALQGLTTLDIRTDDDAPLTKAFIDSLCAAHSDGTPCLLPLLENLELGGESEGFTVNTLVMMAEARRQMGRPLKRFLLNMMLMGMSNFDFGWTDKVEARMCQVADELEVCGRNCMGIHE